MTVDRIGGRVTEEDSAPEARERSQSPQQTRPRRHRLPAIALVVATAVLVSGSVAWWRADHDPSASVADQRDSALIAAREHLETMNTLDYRDVEAGLEAWADVTTGTLHDQLSEVDDEERALLAEQRKISVGRVVDAAVLEVDGSTATVIASLEITVRDDADPDAEPTVKRNRFSADLLRVGGEWKVEDLQQVAVNLS